MALPETLRQWCGGSWLTTPSVRPVAELAIDSRRINEPSRAAFIALPTGRRDGHDYLRPAYDAGVRMFVVSKEVVDVSLYPDAAFLHVRDTLMALQAIAAGHRKEFSIPVIGITGSNGKTVVKEWLYSALSEDRRVVRSPKSFNSQIGVPLSVWLLQPEDELAIFEAGISQPAEMEALERLIRPTIGIFTNIGEAHSEGFLNMRQKIGEKLKLFLHCPTLIYCRDYADLHEVVLHFTSQTKDVCPARRVFSWSFKGDADFIIDGKESAGGRTAISAHYEGRKMTVTIPFTDAASVENAIHVWCTLLLLELDDAVIIQRLSALQAVEMRLQTHRGTGSCTIINDAYNSDLTSLAISLDFLESQRQHHRRTLILSDMLQIGKPDGELYEEVAGMIMRRGIRRFIGIGPALGRAEAIFRARHGLDCAFYPSTADFLKDFHRLTFEDEAILLKGARAFAFEQIDALLQEEVHQTVLSINLSALAHNLATFRAYTGPSVKVMAMVKAFSYGSGSYEIASALQYAGVDYLSVAYTDEGVTLRKSGITLPIMVMSPEAAAFDRMIAWRLEPEIFNQRSLDAFVRTAQAPGVTEYPVHIKLDTGMHRLGFAPNEVAPLIEALQGNAAIKVASVFSHLAAAEDVTQDAFTAKQAAIFSAVSGELIASLGYKPFRHLCNTAGIARHPELHYDMVRLGLGLYGIDGSGTLSHELQQLGTLRTVIAQIKDLPAGEGIGYGHSDAAEHRRRIATISIGYADGYPRALGHGRAHVLVRGKAAMLVGTVCMDMCMVDITHIPDAAEGDEVIVFGTELPLTLLADWSGTIPYEIMTGISQRVKRVYVAE